MAGSPFLAGLAVSARVGAKSPVLFAGAVADGLARQLALVIVEVIMAKMGC